MLQGKFELTIVQVKGVSTGTEQLGCYVSLDNQLIGVIAPLCPMTHNNTIEFTTPGTLQLTVRPVDPSLPPIGGVSIYSELLPSEDFQWLTLCPEVTAKPLKVSLLLNSRELSETDSVTRRLQAAESALQEQTTRTRNCEVANRELTDELAQINELLGRERNQFRQLIGKNEAEAQKNKEREE